MAHNSRDRGNAVSPYLVHAGNEPAIKGSPAWINSARYTIVAEAEGGQSEAMMRGPMMQSLLEDRFNLRIHHEAKEISVYSLIVAKAGPKLQPSHEGSCIPLDPDHLRSKANSGSVSVPLCGFVRESTSGDGLDMKGVAMEDLCRQLTAWLGQEVIDKTGIAGTFDIHLELTFADLAPGNAAASGNAGGKVIRRSPRIHPIPPAQSSRQSRNSG